MRGVALGRCGRSGYAGTCPQDTRPFSEPLQTVLGHVMEQSDNARTQAVTAYFT